MDRLEYMLAKQRELQIESFGGKDPGELEGDERADFIRWNVLALEDELHEALGEVGWKPWASSRHVNRAAYKGELVDAFHFFMNLCLVANITAEELHEGYLAKRERNAVRQQVGYDGLSGKCPQCKRDLKDVGKANDQLFFPVIGDLVFCSGRCATTYVTPTQ